MSRKPLALVGEPRIELYEGDIDADLARIDTIKEADKITGGFSKPSKMPEWVAHRFQSHGPGHLPNASSMRPARLPFASNRS